MVFDLKSWLTGFALGLAGKPFPLPQGKEPVEPEQPAINPTAYLTFASTKKFTLSVNNSTKNWDGTLYYSTDTESWNEWDGTEPIESAEHSGGHRIYMCGLGNHVITGKDDSDTAWYLKPSGIGIYVQCTGNIETLLDYATVENGAHPSMDSYCYANMFRGNNKLTKAPELPATVLTDYCYAHMFRSSLLQKTPALPATVLADYCYYDMFAICYALTEASPLPATTLADYCYYNMFYQCNELLTIPALPATTLADYCYRGMFYLDKKIKLSQVQTEEYSNEYRIPKSGAGEFAAGAESTAMLDMFAGAGGTFTGTPNLNQTYYTSNRVV